MWVLRVTTVSSAQLWDRGTAVRWSTTMTCAKGATSCLELTRLLLSG